MRKTFLLLNAALLLCTDGVRAQQVDTMRVVELEQVQIEALRATGKTPVAFTNLSRREIQSVNYGQDVPFLLSLTPSVTMTSDAGNGVGYTSLRVRGTDPSRINITANGVPLNDGESSLVYFSNMGDFASSVKSIQMQRGVGTSTNGAGAFGATVNMLTEGISATPYVGTDFSAGSYGTHKETIRFGTGLFGGHFGMQGRLSNIGSDGYIDRASSSLNSYFLQAGYFSDNTSVKFITFNGAERTYMAWNYTSKQEQSIYGRRYNSCGLYYDADGNMRFYEDQYDNYRQQHYQLHWNQLLGDKWKLNVALHHTHDSYDYDQMKTGKKLYQWLLTDDRDMRADLVQRKDGKKNFFGGIASLNFDNRSGLTAHVGGALNRLNVDHKGHVLWVGTPYYKGAADVALPLSGLQPKFQYYGNESKKTDGNIYAKANWEFMHGLSAFADMQYRHVYYRMDGRHDEWDDNGQMRLDLDKSWDFFNPKLGLNWQPTANHRLYASYSVAHREPTRDNYIEHWGESVKAERLGDFELGYIFSSSRFTAGVNVYNMYYRDQFVLTGELNDEGEAITKNLPRSYRMGVEIEAGWEPLDWLRWDMNATLSKNRVKDMMVTLDDYTTKVNLGETPLSFSPAVIFNNILTFQYKGWRAAVQSQFVGEQYMTNYGVKTMRCWSDWSQTDDVATDETLMLKQRFTTNLDLSYTRSLPTLHVQSATLGVALYNIFSAKYDNNGWAAPQFRQDASGKVYAVNTWGLRDEGAVGFAPSAPFNFLVHLSLNF